MSTLREATFLRPSEAAEITGLSTRAIYRAIERGELRAARLCSRLRTPRAAFDEWVDACASAPPSACPRRTREYLRPSPAASGRCSLIARSPMSIERIQRKDGSVVRRVRWRHAGQNRSKVLGRKRDAEAFDAELRRRKRTGEIAALDAGKETLAEFGEEWWRLYAEPNLAPTTLQVYAVL
jgi:excisionase family DNA binding protein